MSKLSYEIKIQALTIVSLEGSCDLVDLFTGRELKGRGTKMAQLDRVLEMVRADAAENNYGDAYNKVQVYIEATFDGEFSKGTVRFDVKGDGSDSTLWRWFTARGYAGDETALFEPCLCESCGAETENNWRYCKPCIREFESEARRERAEEEYDRR